MRRAVIIVLSIIAILILVVIALPLFINVNQFRPQIESQLTNSLGRDVKIGNLDLSILSGKVTARDLSIADDPAFSRMPFVTAKSLALTVGIIDAVLHHQLNVSAIEIDSPQAVLTQSASGLWNFSSLGGKTKPQVRPVSTTTNDNFAVSIASLKISNARVSIDQGGGARPEILDSVSAEVKNFTPAAAFPFSVSGKIEGGGDFSISGQAGPMNQANAASTPLTAAIKVNGLNLVASGTVPSSSGVDGLLSIDASATSDGRTFRLNGKLTGEKLKLASGATPARNPLTFDVDLADDLMRRTGQMTRGDVAIGGVKARLTGTWAQQAANTDLKMLLAAPGVPVSAVEDLLPALGIFLPSGARFQGGTASANLTIAGPSTAPVIAGPVAIQSTRLTGFDLGSKLAPILKLAGIQSGPNTDIQTLSTDLRIAPDTTTLQNIRAVLPSIGQLTGAGSISKSQALAFRMMATVHGSGLISSSGTLNVPFTIEGSSSNPQFRPDVGQIAAQQLNQRLQGVKVGGVDVGQTAGGLLGGIFGGKKKK